MFALIVQWLGQKQDLNGISFENSRHDFLGDVNARGHVCNPIDCSNYLFNNQLLLIATVGRLAPANKLDTKMPKGKVPQYDNCNPTLPKNNMSSHVAGKVASRKTTMSEISPLIMTSK